MLVDAQFNRVRPGAMGDREVVAGGRRQNFLQIVRNLPEAVVSGEVELDDPAARWVVVDSDGRRTPVAVDIARGERAFEVEIPSPEFKAIVASLSAPQVLGRTVNAYRIVKADAAAPEVELSLSRAAITDIDLARFRDDIRNALPDTGVVRIKGSNAPRCAISFMATGLQQAGFSFYRLAKDGESSTELIAAPADAIENEFYRLEPSARGVLIRELASGEAMELHFEDEGDRGDEYNYDPVAGGAIISKPVETAVEAIENGVARKRMRLRLTFELPESIADDRRSRSARLSQISVMLTATLYPGLARVDFIAEVDNRARDHRLRAALRTPVQTIETLSDTSFGFVRRSIAPSEPLGTEAIYPTAPHRSVTAIESEGLSAALMSRGIYEIEARRESDGTTLLLTLLRCVGWLSRSDLTMRNGGAGPEFESPGAQEQGTSRFEFAMTSYRGSYLEAGLAPRAAAYAFPPRTFVAREPAAAAAPTQLIGCDNPRVVFSTARPDRRARSYLVRLWTVSPDSERARFTFGAGRTARVLDLAGRAMKREGVRRRQGALEMNLRPFEIVSFSVASEKKFVRIVKKH